MNMTNLEASAGKTNQSDSNEQISDDLFDCDETSNNQQRSYVSGAAQSAAINTSILKVPRRQTTTKSTCAAHAALMREASL